MFRRFILLEPTVQSTRYIIMADSSDQTQVLHDVNHKLQHIKDCFECFQEDFKNIAFVGNNIRVRLNDCCVDAVVPFDTLLNGFVDVLNTFDRSVKSTLNAWLTIESHLAGR